MTPNRMQRQGRPGRALARAGDEPRPQAARQLRQPRLDPHKRMTAPRPAQAAEAVQRGSCPASGGPRRSPRGRRGACAFPDVAGVGLHYRRPLCCRRRNNAEDDLRGMVLNRAARLAQRRCVTGITPQRRSGLTPPCRQARKKTGDFAGEFPTHDTRSRVAPYLRHQPQGASPQASVTCCSLGLISFCFSLALYWRSLPSASRSIKLSAVRYISRVCRLCVQRPALLARTSATGCCRTPAGMSFGPGRSTRVQLACGVSLKWNWPLVSTQL